MSMISITKGKFAENLFQKWLNSKQLPYLRIDQDRNIYSQSLLTQFDAKRPDFIMMIPKIGLLFVDVKGIKPFQSKFDLKPEEIEKYLNLEKYFNFKLFFAFYDETMNPEAFHWISLTKTNEVKILREIPNKNGGFHYTDSIPCKDCTTIAFDEDHVSVLSKLISLDS